ncbi:hypothetical protein HD554DRAFT_2252704 [Boletus coccyginus]|nr:hypothetical protein HD554DRAFT_2252704 [Boletus coccyginus]
MSTKKQRQGPILPKSLLEHIDRQVASGNLPRNKGKNTHLSRKDSRKQERLDCKKRRADHFSTRTVAVKCKNEEEHIDVPDSKRRKAVHFPDQVKSSTPSQRTHAHDPPELSDAQNFAKSRSKPTALEKLASRSTREAPKAASRIPRTREEADEDAYIAYLEDRLGYSNGSRRGKGDEADGLGDLLDFADELEGSLLVPPSHPDANSDRDSSVPDDMESSGVGDAPDNPSEWGSSTDDDQVEVEERDDGDEWTGFGTNDNEPSQHDPATEEANIKESETRPSGRYIPPGLRKEYKTSEGEDIVKLTRQLKGLINRMSEQNMSTVLDAIEEVYRNHRRHDVTSTLTSLMIDGISSHGMLLDSFVVLHAAFISSLHRLIGVEFAAFVVQNVVSAYGRHLRDYESDVPNVITKPEERGKECSNLLVLLSELYNFQVISCILLYDIIKDLLGKTLSEFRVELLLKILRSSGQQLRQDDPLALKDIVTLAQSSIANQDDNLSSRTKFMIETLTNLKNNKIKKSATQHQGGDAVERMKKFLSGLGKKRHVQAHEALRVSLGDLRAAETKGKWWLVGAAWGGDPLVDQQRATSTKQNDIDVEDISNTALVRLARQQGMNTDIRRSIFVVLMSSDDYLDACERLAQLNLSEVQQREIVRVILHCCGNGKSYNPYYALVCQQLCQRSHAYKITLQFCLWDFLRDLGETRVGGAEVIKNLKDDRFDLKTVSSSRMKNVAKAYGWWIAKDCCSITILKPVDFTVLKPQTRNFLRELFVQIFVASQASSPVLTDDDANEQKSRNRGTVEDIFIKATKIEIMGLGLIFFLSNVFKGEEGLLGWASALAKETLQTGMNEIPRL